MNKIGPQTGLYINKNNTIRQQIDPSNTRSSLRTPSFKGTVPTQAVNGIKTLFTEADKKVLNVFSQHYGNVGARLGQKVAKLTTSSELLNKSARFTLEEGVKSIKDKNIAQSVLENVLFPFINIPLYSASWILKKAQSIPSLKEGARKLYNKPIFRIPRKFNELDAKTNMIKGIFDKTKDTISKFAKEKGVSYEYLLNQLNKTDDTPEAKQLVKEANEYIKESLYKVSNKFFDKHTGNYNTAYERPLNRIVSGLIPAAFLANDAYNLSVLCGDKKEVSKEEAKSRRKQEISRVFTTAYIQLLTLGAFTKQVNTISWFAPVTSALTVLFSETTSRKRLGKPIFFLSKDKAKEYNKKEAEKSDKNNDNNKLKTKNKNQKENKPPINTNFTALNTDEPKVFNSFKASVEKDVNQKNENKEETKQSKPKKALINADTFKKGVTILITGGFVLSFLKNSSYTKNTKLIKGIKNFGKLCKEKLYNPLAFKDFKINQKDFEKLSQNLKEVGCKEIVEGHEFIKNKYAKQTADGFIKIYKSSLSDSKAQEVIKSTIDNLKKSNGSLTEAQLKEAAAAIKTAIGLEKTSIAENKFGYVAKKASEIIQNKKLDLNEAQLKEFSENLTASLAKNVKESAVQVDTKLKPFVDIVTEPFKFVFAAARLPFKITSAIVKIAVSPIEKKAAKAALGNAQLSKTEKTIHKVVTEIFGEKEAKAGKISQTIFSNAMEQLQRRTKPYQKAKLKFEEAVANNAGKEQIAKAKEILEKEKLNLLKYVNTSVEKSFNGVTQSSNKNTDLAMMTKLASSAVTSAFLVADNYNMVMIKSNGEDKEGAKETANERIIQRLSGLFYQTLFINWFNSTFRSTYNSSLKGMAAVVIPNTITTEVITRKSIGMPIGRKSFKELQENEEKNENRKGFLGKYFKFMRLLTGKKPLKDRIPKDKNSNNATKPTSDQNIINNKEKANTTNLLEKYTK